MININTDQYFDVASNVWTCGVCGAWVSYSEWHNCPGWKPARYVIANEPWNTNPLPDPMKEIHDKLDEIIKLLKKTK